MWKESGSSLKRVGHAWRLIHIAGHILGLLMCHLIGPGTLQQATGSVQERVHGALSTFGSRLL
jgi:hypothetical protein